MLWCTRNIGHIGAILHRDKMIVNWQFLPIQDEPEGLRQLAYDWDIEEETIKRSSLFRTPKWR